MSARTDHLTDRSAALTLSLLDELFGDYLPRYASVRLWDGTCWPDSAPRATTLVFKHPGTLRAMFIPGNEVSLAEAYLYDDFDIEGDVESLFNFADALLQTTSSWRKKLRASAQLFRLPAARKHWDGQRMPRRLTGQRHSVERDRQAVTFHYDVSNEFYVLWLDSRMVYSCAYFQSPEANLESAQESKLDYVCRKLRLQPGQRLLDVGCGWGGLVIHAAKHFGVDATGITLSEPQAILANERINAAGLKDRCRVQVRDYRQVEDLGAYDAIVSIGMFEHVGAAMLPTYFERALRLLRPGGVFLNHGIAIRATEQQAPGPSFVDTYVFPDGELIPIGVTLRAAEHAGFEVRDVESLREHYTLTLRHWVRRLEAQYARARAIVGEPTYRVWRLYMAGSAHGFAIGRNNVYQTLLVKPQADGCSGLPLTRTDWYAGALG